MPKITDEPLEAIQIRLFQKDLDYLRSIFKGNIGVNRAMRTIVRSYVAHAKATAATLIDQTEVPPQEPTP
jgi:hypothetical protein